MSVTVAIIATTGNKRLMEAAAALAETLNLPLVESNISGFDFVLDINDQRLQLCDLREPGLRPVSVDLLQKGHSLNTANLTRKQPLARAMGRGAKTIVDTTAGFGHDAFLLACLGYRVVAIERAGIIFALFKNALARALSDARLQKRLKDRLSCELMDARDYLRALTELPDVVYLDPMYPPKRKKSALTKRSLRVLREIVGDDSDAAGLFEVARKHARRRVVVKRPHYAPPLVDDPDVSISGKLVRYDVYLIGK